MILRAWIAGKLEKLTRPEIRRMKKLWAKIPAVRCKGLCQDSCTNVPVQAVEAYYLIEKYNATLVPHTHPGNVCMPTLGANGPCEFLKAGRCSIYEDRPLACRAFGHPILSLKCSHNCTVEKPMSGWQFAELIHKLVAVLSDAQPLTDDPEQLVEDVTRQVDQMTVMVESDEELK